MLYHSVVIDYDNSCKLFWSRTCFWLTTWHQHSTKNQQKKKKKKQEQGAHYWPEKLLLTPVSQDSHFSSPQPFWNTNVFGTIFSAMIRTKSESPAADGRTSRIMGGRLKMIKRSGVFIRLEAAEIQESSTIC